LSVDGARREIARAAIDLRPGVRARNRNLHAVAVVADRFGMDLRAKSIGRFFASFPTSGDQIMPSTQVSSKRGRATRTTRAREGKDAISLLKSDHREVEGWFEDFKKARADTRKQDLASKICEALTIHATIEEEIFYPAFHEATQEDDLYHEAQVEHDGAKNLIAKIEQSDPSDELFDAQVNVLSEMIKHHVREEEKRDGMFAKARQSDMDLDEIGRQLEARKAELKGKSRPGLVSTMLKT
jgi:hemerythrin superfamily protein